MKPIHKQKEQQDDKMRETKSPVSRADLAFQAYSISFQEAHVYLRDTSRQIEELVKFYLTGATALVGAIAYPFVAGSSETITKAILISSTAILSGLGIAVFLRLVRKKVQAAQQTAWGKRVEYGMFVMAFGKNNKDVDKPPPPPYGAPVSRQVIFILTVFSVLNSVVLSLCTLAICSLVLEVANYKTFSPNEFYFAVYGIPTLLLSALAFFSQRIYLNNQIQEARSEYARIISPPIPSLLE